MKRLKQLPRDDVLFLRWNKRISVPRAEPKSRVGILTEHNLAEASAFPAHTVPAEQTA